MARERISEVFSLKGKAAIVTGGAAGIGRSIVDRLAEAGASVLIADIDFGKAEEVASQVRSVGGRVESFRADAGSAGDASRTVKTTVDRFGRLDILVNNAGIYPTSAFLDITEEMWTRTVHINLTGVFHYSQAAARQMIAEGRKGTIVNMSSMEAFRPFGGLAHYDATKGGVVSLTRSMALELAPHGIRVNCIAPGMIATEPLKRAITAEMDQRFKAWIPLGRMGEPDDIGTVALFLASAASSYMTGSTVVVDGGNLLK